MHGSFVFQNNATKGNFIIVTEPTNDNFQSVKGPNIIGVMNSMKYKILAVSRNSCGFLANISPVTGSIGMPGQSLICLKNAVIGLTKVSSSRFWLEMYPC